MKPHRRPARDIYEAEDDHAYGFVHESIKNPRILGKSFEKRAISFWKRIDTGLLCDMNEAFEVEHADCPCTHKTKTFYEVSGRHREVLRLRECTAYGPKYGVQKGSLKNYCRRQAQEDVALAEEDVALELAL